jgi:hypothetical protein
MLQIQSLHGQNINIDSIRYSNAYGFIKNNTPEKRIKVSRCIVDFDLWMFPLDSLADFPEKKDSFMRLVERKLAETDKVCLYDDDVARIANIKQPRKVLYFSQIEDNMLIACLLLFDKRRHKKSDIDNFDVISRFNEPEYYLFFFDEDNTIKKVIRVFVNSD